MDDLAGLDWSAPTQPSKPPPRSSTPGSYLQYRSPTIPPQQPPLLSSPLSSFNGAPSRPASTRPFDVRSASPAVGAGNDSFSSLVSFSGRKNGGAGNLSLLEQQRRLQEEKAKKEEVSRDLFDKQFGGLDSLGSISRTSSSTAASPSTNVTTTTSSNDFLDAFSADSQVSKQSYFPPPSQSTLRPDLSSSKARSSSRQASSLSQSTTPNEAFSELSLDPFEVNNLPSRTTTPFHQPQIPQNDDEDDVLGLLGKPLSALPPKVALSSSQAPTIAKTSQSSRQTEHTPELSTLARTPPPGRDPRDPAIAELVDMGFTVEDAKRALAETETGLDVRAAVDYLLHQAHGKTNSRKHTRRPEDEERRRPRKEEGRRDENREVKPAWSKEQSDEKDIASYATEIGGTLLKSAGSLWSTGRKRVVKVINEMQDDAPNDGTPKWMRDAQRDQEEGRKERKPVNGADMTDEAMMLETAKRKEREKSRNEAAALARKREFELQEREKERRRLEKERDSRTPDLGSRRPKTRELVEEASHYISPARRRKAAPAPPPVQALEPIQNNVPEGDLLFGETSANGRTPQLISSRSSQTQSSLRHAQTQTQTPLRSAVTNRPIPSLSSSSLASSNTFKSHGSESFKRGDYPQALIYYTSALNPLPSTHPLRYILLSNRALVQIKLGDSKAAIADCDEIVNGIGPSRGEGETINPGDGSGTTKDMKEIWGKAIVRRAEALEHLEKWSDAVKAWQLALESGAGGSAATASAGKARCEKALAPKQPASSSQNNVGGSNSSSINGTRSAPSHVRRPQQQQTQKTNVPPSAASKQAVSKLRAANAAAEKVDDEKFALHEQVESKIQIWKGGKETNLRALIASLDTVLWEGSGWKKVGLHELVMPGKVKIAYMKGIGKVHPDKVSTTATTEQKMLSAAVFSTLNEAWDDFKKQNNL